MAGTIIPELQYKRGADAQMVVGNIFALQYKILCTELPKHWHVDQFFLHL